MASEKDDAEGDSESGLFDRVGDDAMFAGEGSVRLCRKRFERVLSKALPFMLNGFRGAVPRMNQ